MFYPFISSVSASEGKLMLRVGNVIFLKIGQLCPKVKGTYTDTCIYPVSLFHYLSLVASCGLARPSGLNPV